MTDEEKLAEEYANGRGHEHYHFLFEENNGCPADFAKLCYLDGLVDGRKEQWHKVADGDYPPRKIGDYTIDVLTDCGDIAYYNYNHDCWLAEPSSAEIDPPIAWCEIPKYEE